MEQALIDTVLAQRYGLDREKPVVICGDMNVAHNEINLKKPKPSMGSAGFSAIGKPCDNVWSEGQRPKDA